MSKEMTTVLKKHIAMLLACFFLCLIGMVIRLSYVQIGEGKRLLALAREQQTRNRTIVPTSSDNWCN